MRNNSHTLFTRSHYEWLASAIALYGTQADAWALAERVAFILKTQRNFNYDKFMEAVHAQVPPVGGKG